MDEDGTRVADRAWVASVLEQLAARGPLPYQALDPGDQAWRGRYCLMAASLGRLPALAWGAAMAPDHEGSEAEIRAIVAATDDADIAAALRENEIRVEDLLVY